MSFCCLFNSLNISADESLVKGDFNGDGQFNSADLAGFVKWMTGVEVSHTDDIINVMDFNSDGKINILDFCLAKNALTELPKEPSYVIASVRDLDEYIRINDALKADDGSSDYYIIKYLEGDNTREMAEKFVDHVNSNQIPDFFKGDVSWISYQYGISVDEHKPFEIMYISVKRPDGEWVRYEYIFSIKQSDKNYYGYKDAEVTEYETPVTACEGRMKIYAKSVRPHYSGTGYMVTLFTDIDDVVVDIDYYITDLDDFDINSIISSSLIDVVDIER